MLCCDVLVGGDGVEERGESGEEGGRARGGEDEKDGRARSQSSDE